MVTKLKKQYATLDSACQTADQLIRDYADKWLGPYLMILNMNQDGFRQVLPLVNDFRQWRVDSKVRDIQSIPEAFDLLHANGGSPLSYLLLNCNTFQLEYRPKQTFVRTELSKENELHTYPAIGVRFAISDSPWRPTKILLTDLEIDKCVAKLLETISENEHMGAEDLERIS